MTKPKVEFEVFRTQFLNELETIAKGSGAENWQEAMAQVREHMNGKCPSGEECGVLQGLRDAYDGDLSPRRTAESFAAHFWDVHAISLRDLAAMLVNPARFDDGHRPTMH